MNIYVTTFYRGSTASMITAPTPSMDQGIYSFCMYMFIAVYICDWVCEKVHYSHNYKYLEIPF